MAEVFDDPKLKREAKKFGKSAVDSVKSFGERFKDKDVKEKFNKAGKAAQKFGRQMEKVGRDVKKKVRKKVKK